MDENTVSMQNGRSELNAALLTLERKERIKIRAEKKGKGGELLADLLPSQFWELCVQGD